MPSPRGLAVTATAQAPPLTGTHENKFLAGTRLGGDKRKGICLKLLRWFGVAAEVRCAERSKSGRIKPRGRVLANGLAVQAP